MSVYIYVDSVSGQNRKHPSWKGIWHKGIARYLEKLTKNIEAKISSPSEPHKLLYRKNERISVLGLFLYNRTKIRPKKCAEEQWINRKKPASPSPFGIIGSRDS